MAHTITTGWTPAGELGDTLRILFEAFGEPTTGDKWWIPFLDEPTQLRLAWESVTAEVHYRDLDRIYGEAERIAKVGRFAPGMIDCSAEDEA